MFDTGEIRDNFTTKLNPYGLLRQDMENERSMKRWMKSAVCCMACCCLYIGAIPFSAHAGYTEFRMGEPVIAVDDNEPTKVTIVGNSVLVPARFVYRSNDIEVLLLLDTGATKTIINTDIADKLSIDLGKTKKSQVQVIGGAMIDAYSVKMNNLHIGPHVRRNIEIFVVPHKGPTVEFDGLLGMDVLRGLKYRVDYNKKIIVWE